MAIEKTPERATAGSNPSLAQLCDGLYQSQVRLLGNQIEYLLRKLFQWKRERRPSYHSEEEVVVGRELPPGAYKSYEVPEEYVPRGHHYTVINDRPVIFHSETRRIIHVYE